MRVTITANRALEEKVEQRVVEKGGEKWQCFPLGYSSDLEIRRLVASKGNPMNLSWRSRNALSQLLDKPSAYHRIKYCFERIRL